jgi:hypothetical protein
MYDKIYLYNVRFFTRSDIFSNMSKATMTKIKYLHIYLQLCFQMSRGQ